MVTETNQPSAPAVRSSLPPEQKFWKRYSPHHEMPLSTAASLAVHALTVGLLLLAGFVAVTLGVDKQNDPVPVGAAFVNPEGNDLDKPKASDPAKELQPVEAVPNAEPKRELPGPVALPRFGPVKGPANDLPPLDRKEAGDFLAQAKDAAEKLGNLKKSQGDQKGRASSSQPKPSGGDKDGKGTGGKKKGKPDAKISAAKQDRMVRWRMRFNTINGQDYLRQLDSLGAILGVPEKDKDGSLLIIRDLKKLPAKGKAEDLTKIQRIYWVDDATDSVKSLAEALQLGYTPPHIVCFFPEKLEQELLRKEIGFKGKKEGEIEETHFEVIRKGKGFEAKVVFQK